MIKVDFVLNVNLRIRNMAQVQESLVLDEYY